MSAAWAITKREMRTYFNSPVAYIVATVYLLLAGYFFFSGLFLENQAELRSYFNLTPIFFCFIVPAITMRLLAEEKGSGTLELLITMPIRDWEVVLGKFLAAFGLIAVIVGITTVYGFTVASVGDLDDGPAITGYLALLLMGAAYAAIGVMASSFTRNQIVAFIIAFGISFSLFIMGNFVPLMPQSLQPLLSFLAIGEHMQSMARGVIDTRDLFYYLSIVAVCLVVASLTLESRKWR